MLPALLSGRPAPDPGFWSSLAVLAHHGQGRAVELFRDDPGGATATGETEAP